MTQPFDFSAHWAVMPERTNDLNSTSVPVGYAYEQFAGWERFLTQNTDENVRCTILFRNPQNHAQAIQVIMSDRINKAFRAKELSLDQVMCLPIDLKEWDKTVPVLDANKQPVIENGVPKTTKIRAKAFIFQKPAGGWVTVANDSTKKPMTADEYENAIQ